MAPSERWRLYTYLKKPGDMECRSCHSLFDVSNINEKCTSCRILRTSVSDFIALNWHLHDRPMIVDGCYPTCELCGTDQWMENPLGVCFCSDDDNLHECFYEIYTDQESFSYWHPTIPLRNHIEIIPTVAHWAALAKAWLAHCKSTHPSQCQPMKNTLPTRVIAVGDPDQNPRLYETQSEKADYVCLSYCWGLGQKFVTETSNYEARKAGFMLGSLPATIRDAVLLTRAIGVRYIWVDALCIIQDSLHDWEKESAMMCSVYANATLTIAAMDSPHSGAGLIPKDIVRSATRIDTEKGPIYFRKQYHADIPDLYPNPGLFDDHECPYLNDNKCRPHRMARPSSPAVLVTRGWTLQELALSRRILWCRNKELAWSCECGLICECDAVHKDPERGSTTIHLQFGKPPPTNPDEMNPYQYTADRWVSWWRKILHHFTRRQLTHQTDRLHALAGIAASVQQMHNYRYLAGVWDFSIETQLMWCCKIQSDRTHDRPLPFRYAPSWSPGSVTSPIVYSADVGVGMPDARLEWKIKSVDFSAHGLNLFGPGHGVLSIHCLIMPVKAVLVYDLSTDGATYTLILPKLPDLSQSDDLCVACASDDLAETSLLLDRRPGTLSGEELASKDLVCILAVQLQPNTYENSPAHRCGLLLEQISPSRQGRRLKRVGAWTTYPRRPSPTTYNDRSEKETWGRPLAALPDGYTFGTMEQWEQLGQWETVNIV